MEIHQYVFCPSKFNDIFLQSLILILFAKNYTLVLVGLQYLRCLEEIKTYIGRVYQGDEFASP